MRERPASTSDPRRDDRLVVLHRSRHRHRGRRDHQDRRSRAHVPGRDARCPLASQREGPREPRPRSDILRSTDDVILYANATILGGNTVIGRSAMDRRQLLPGHALGALRVAACSRPAPPSAPCGVRPPRARPLRRTRGILAGDGVERDRRAGQQPAPPDQDPPQGCGAWRHVGAARAAAEHRPLRGPHGAHRARRHGSSLQGARSPCSIDRSWRTYEDHQCPGLARRAVRPRSWIASSAGQGGWRASRIRRSSRSSTWGWIWSVRSWSWNICPGGAAGRREAWTASGCRRSDPTSARASWPAPSAARTSSASCIATSSRPTCCTPARISLEAGGFRDRAHARQRSHATRHVHGHARILRRRRRPRRSRYTAQADVFA